MENIRRQAKNCAENLRLCASSAGTVDLFNACLDGVVNMAASLDCNRARNTGAPGYGILFETAGKENAGRFSFFATRPKFERGVVALAISDSAVGERASDLHALVQDIRRRYRNVVLPVDGRYTWPTIGFTSLAAGEQIIDEVGSFLNGKKRPYR